MFRTRMLATGTALLVLAVAVSGTQAGEVSQELSRDEATVAAQKGWTAGETVAFFRAEDILDQIAGAVAEKRPDVFVGSALPAKPGSPPTLYIKGAADHFVASLVAEAAITIVLEDRQPFSRRELDDRTAKAAEALRDLGYPEALVYADIQDLGAMKAVLPYETSADALQLFLGRLEVGFSVDVEVSSTSAKTELQSVTGGMMTGTETQPLCTSGFTVKKTVNGVTTKGIVSAGHCTSIQVVYDHVNDVFNDTTYKYGHVGPWGDFEWYTTPANEADDFYADVNDRRDVSDWEGVGQISMLEPVCHFGWGPPVDHECSDVGVVNASCAGRGGQTIMVTGVTDVGDSGGPWFFNNKAYGIHTGLCGGNSYWSKVGYMDEALYDVFVATTN